MENETPALRVDRKRGQRKERKEDKHKLIIGKAYKKKTGGGGDREEICYLEDGNKKKKV